MNILAAIKREEKKVRKQLARLQNQLNGLASAAEALGNSTSRQVDREIKGVKKRVLSAAGRAAIIKAAKKRWAKVRSQAKKVAG
jgi:cell division septum initiation protein DivIVA